MKPAYLRGLRPATSTCRSSAAQWGDAVGGGHAPSRASAGNSLRLACKLLICRWMRGRSGCIV
jgi:hypothetical protein